MTDHIATRMAAPVATRAASQVSVPAGALPLPVKLYIIMFMLPVTFYLGPLYMTNLRLLLVIMVVPLTVQLFTGKFGRILWTDILFFAHMAWAGLTLAINNPSMVITQMGSIGPEFLGGYLIGRAYIRDKASFIALAKWLVVAVILTLPAAMYETKTGTPIVLQILGKLPGFGSFPFVTYETRMGLERVQGMLTHPIHYGLFASMMMSMALVALKDVVSNTRRLIYAFLVAFATFLSLSSGAILPIIAQLFFIGWARAFDRTGRPWLILTALVALAYVTIDALSNRTPIQVFFSYATFSPHNASIRQIIFDWGMVNVWMSPIIGIGMADWVRPAWMQASSVDNFWLLMAMRYGIPAFLLIAAGYFLAMWKIGRRDLGDDRMLNQLRRAWMFTFLCMSFTLATVHVWTNIYSFVFMVFGAGMWLAEARPDVDRTAPGPDPVAPRGGPVYSRVQAGPATVTAPETPAPDREGPRYTRFDQPVVRRR